MRELTGKDHKHVLTDVRNMCELLKIQSPEFLGDYKDDKGRTYPCFNLPKRETLITTRTRGNSDLGLESAESADDNYAHARQLHLKPVESTHLVR